MRMGEKIHIWEDFCSLPLRKSSEAHQMISPHHCGGDLGKEGTGSMGKAPGWLTHPCALSGFTQAVSVSLTWGRGLVSLSLLLVLLLTSSNHSPIGQGHSCTAQLPSFISGWKIPFFSVEGWKEEIWIWRLFSCFCFTRSTCLPHTMMDLF